MFKINFVKAVAVMVVLVGVMVLAGWILGIAAWTSLRPDWVTMKFTTAICFTMSGVLLLVLAGVPQRRMIGGLSQILVTACVLGISLFMGTLFMSAVFNLNSGIEQLFVSEADGAVQTVRSGIPSLGTTINFILIAGAGIVSLLSRKFPVLMILLTGGIVGSAGAIALLGYAMKLPILYFYVPPWSSGMAFHTALLFALLGAGFVMIPNKK